MRPTPACRRRILRVAACGLAFFGAADSVTGGVPIIPTDGELLADERFVVAAVTVQNVTPQIGTRGSPPRVVLAVRSVLRGRLASRTIEAVWQSPDYYLGSTEEEEVYPSPAWLAEPLEGPARGARMIVLLAPQGDTLLILNRCRYPDTPERRSFVRTAMAEVIAWRREAIRQYRAERAKIDRRRRAWRRTVTADAIARSARDADFVGIGRLSSGPNANLATFIITTTLKGVPRIPYLGSVYFADVLIPAPVLELVEHDIDFILFLDENGMNLEQSIARYPLAGEGLVLADASARRIVRESLARTPAKPRPPFCVVMIAGYAYRLPHHETGAIRNRIADGFSAAGAGRCTVAISNTLTSVTPPDWAGAMIRKLFLGATGAVLAHISDSGNVTLSGIRIDPQSTHVVFSDASWPVAADEQRATARRLLQQLVNRKRRPSR